MNTRQPDAQDGPTHPEATSDSGTIAAYRAQIAELSAQAAAEGCPGLSGLGELLVVALEQLPVKTVPATLAETLAALSEAFTAYLLGDDSAIAELILTLSHPELQIPLSGSQWAQITQQLVTELNAKNAAPDWDELSSAFDTATNWDESEFGETFLLPTDDLVTLSSVKDWAEPTTDTDPATWEDGGFGDDFFLTADDVSQHPEESQSKETLELLELMTLEAALIRHLLTDVANCLSSETRLSEPLVRLSDNLERYQNAAQTAGFSGLAQICGQVNANVRLFADQPEAFAPNHLETLQTWLALVDDYLAHFGELGAGLPLVPLLSTEAWPLPLSLDAAAELVALLQAKPDELDMAASAPRKTSASAEDVSLALPDDVNPELLNILLQELPSQTQTFSAAVQALANGGQLGGQLADLNTAQRIAHTIKGAANTVGIAGIAQLTHALEDILVAYAQQQTLPDGALLDTLLAAADCLEAMSDALNGLAPPPDDALDVLQKTLTWIGRIDHEGLPKSALPELAESNSPIPTLTTPLSVSEPEPTEPAPAASVRVDAEDMNLLFQQAGENLILNTQAQERLRRIKSQLQAMETQFELLRRLGEELDQLIDLKDLSGRASINAATRFDALEMDQYNELHTAGRRMVEAAFDARELNLDAGKELESLQKLLDEHQRLATDNQAAMMKTRVIPVSAIIPRLQRSLRQTCRLTGKRCHLQVSGEHLQVDGDTLNRLLDPLMHLLRNAVDHGIEPAAERLAASKPEIGQLQMAFDRDGNYISVRLSDDGRGLDYGAIYDTAVQRGVIRADETLSEAGLQRLILRPNFSTRSETTQTSGRGVGMDVVNHHVLAQGGSLALHSVVGQGLTVTVKIPLPLSSTHALLTQIGPYRLALSNKGLQQIVFVPGERLTESDTGLRLTVDGIDYPVASLPHLLHLPATNSGGTAHKTALLVNDGEQVTAVLLDAITDSLDIVVKNMGHYIKKLPGYSGAAILGDGSVAPVVDLPELLRNASDLPVTFNDLPNLESVPPPGLAKVLVVDDSLSQRRALEQLLHDAGFQVTTARDGIEAVELLAGVALPDIVLTDLEMPRMNGIELTAHIRGRAALKTLPIIMITSRTTLAHRKLAEETGTDLYLTKPVREEELLAQIQLFLDVAATAHSHPGTA